MTKDDLTPEAHRYLEKYLGLESLKAVTLFGRRPLGLDDVLGFPGDYKHLRNPQFQLPRLEEI